MSCGARRGALALAGLALFLGGCDDERVAKPAFDRSLIVLGIDGMDPVLTRRYLDAGKMPNLQRLVDRGGFIELGTTNPPQSPVAWSTFITGLGLGGHGIYDFVHRDPLHLEPYLSISRPGEPETILGIPAGSGDALLLREGAAFWQLLEALNIPASIVKIPANYPPAKTRMNESSSGMGTPDLMGGYGTYQLFTSDPAVADKSFTAGIVHGVDFVGSSTAKAVMAPPTGADELPIEISRDVKNDQIVLVAGEARALLRAGEWSEWLPLDFAEGLTGKVHGMVRLYLRSVEPLHLYVSPINADPLDSELPISEPPHFAKEMAEDIGRFYTQGMAEETKGLSGGALTDEEFLAQAEIVFSERQKLLRRAMREHRGGLFFFYFSSIDLLSHMYYGSLDPASEARYRRYDWVLPEAYAKMDAVFGEVMEWAGERPLVIMSDHGFGSYRHKVHLNTWLAQKGYLALLPPDEVQKGVLGHIDWKNTQAYALGLNQLFINIEGREARGVIDEADREVLLRRLKRDLESWRFEGMRVVTEAIEPEVGHFEDRAPDLIVGYASGFRSSDSSAQGAVGDEVITVNTDHWNGDHCVHASHVPGLLISTLPLRVDTATLADFAPSILAFFGIDAADDMKGSVLWEL